MVSLCSELSVPEHPFKIHILSEPSRQLANPSHEIYNQRPEEHFNYVSGAWIHPRLLSILYIFSLFLTNFKSDPPFLEHFKRHQQ